MLGGGSGCPLAHKLGLGEHRPPPPPGHIGPARATGFHRRLHDAVCKVLSEAEVEELVPFQETPVSPDPRLPQASLGSFSGGSGGQ